VSTQFGLNPVKASWGVGRWLNGESCYRYLRHKLWQESQEFYPKLYCVQAFRLLESCVDARLFHFGSMYLGLAYVVVVFVACFSQFLAPATSLPPSVHYSSFNSSPGVPPWALNPLPSFLCIQNHSDHMCLNLSCDWASLTPAGSSIYF
jgi:hypothetical protein